MEQLIKFFADGVLIGIAAVAAPLILLSLRHNFWHRAPVFVMAGLTSLLCGKLMSLIYQPEIARPFEKLGVAAGAAYIDNPGFPSDHALLATVIVLALFVVIDKRYRWIAWVLASLVVFMAIARVMALVHTPLDVIFGIIAGLSGGIWYKKLTK